VICLVAVFRRQHRLAALVTTLCTLAAGGVDRALFSNFLSAADVICTQVLYDSGTNTEGWRSFFDKL